MLLLPLLLGAAGTFEIAAMSRIYYPPGDSRISKSEIWLMTGDSRSSIRINQGEAFSGPIWTDRDHVAWVEGRRERMELWVLKPATLERKRILAVPDVYLDEDGLVQIGNKTWRLTGDTLAPAARVETREEAKFVRERGVTSVLWRKQRFQVDNPKASWLASAKAGKTDVSLEMFEEPSNTRIVEVDGATVLLMSYSFTAHDVVELFVKIDAKSKKAHVLPIDAADISFDRQRRRFIAVSGYRAEPYGNLTLWMTDVYLGDARTLQYRKLNIPFSHTTHASLRP